MTQRRWLALCGIGAAILIPAAFVSSGGSPNDDASAATVVSYFRDHRVATQIANLVLVIGAVLLVLFAARLRELLQSGGPGVGVLPTAALCGAVLLAAGVLLDAVVGFALVRAARLSFSGPALAFNVLYNNDFYLITGGIAVLFVAAGIATVRRPVLPRWLGWAAIVIAIISLAGPFGFIGAILAMVWLLVISILMLIRRNLNARGAAEGTAVTDIAMETVS